MLMPEPEKDDRKSCVIINGKNYPAHSVVVETVIRQDKVIENLKKEIEILKSKPPQEEG